MVEPGSKIYEFELEFPNGEIKLYEIRKKSLFLHKLYDEFVAKMNTYNRELTRMQDDLAKAVEKFKDDTQKEQAKKEIERLNKQLTEFNENKIDTSQYLLDGVENILECNNYEFDKDFWVRYVDPAVMRDMIEKTLTKDIISKKKAEQIS